MKYLLSLLLLSVFLMPTTHADHAQTILDQAGKVFQSQTSLVQTDKNTNQANAQSANQTTEVQTEQDKAVKNVTQATGQVAKKAGEALSNVGSQVGEAFQNITGLNQGGNASSK